MNLFINNFTNIFTNILYQILNKIYYWGFYIINTVGAYLSYYITHYNNKYNIFYYFIIITILLLLCVFIFIKIKLGFWNNIPIKNKYTKGYFIKEKNSIINKELPIIDNWCDFLNIKTNTFFSLDKNIINEDIIQKYYFDITPNNSYISLEYSKEKVFNNETNIFENTDKIKNILITIPVNITINNNTYKSYLISDENDTLSINFDKTNYKLFKTHIYNISHERKIHNIFIFKTYRKIDVLQNLITISLYKFKLNNKIKDKNIKLFYNFLEINKQNINLLISFITENKNSISGLFILNLHDILHLIERKELLIFTLYFNNSIRSLYIFKKEKVDYYLISSYNICENNIFYYGFLKSLENIQKNVNNNNIDIYIYDLYYNNIIKTFLSKKNVLNFHNNIHYYIYNYNFDTIIGNNIITFF
jgi:hypothetical protein